MEDKYLYIIVSSVIAVLQSIIIFKMNKAKQLTDDLKKDHEDLIDLKSRVRLVEKYIYKDFR